MKESTTYQAILEEGRTEGWAEGSIAEARKLLRVIGGAQFGAPDDRTASDIERLNDLTTLEELVARVPTVANWKELLGQIARKRRNGPRCPAR